MQKRRRLGLLTIVSVLLTAIIMVGTSYASLGEVVTGQGFAKLVREFSSASLSALGSGSRPSDMAQSPSSPPGPTANYATAGMKLFVLDDGTRQIFGFAPGASQGTFGGSFKIGTTVFSNDASGTRLEGERGWHSIVYYLGDDPNTGNKVYQVNLFNDSGILQDDGYRFEVAG